MTEEGLVVSNQTGKSTGSWVGVWRDRRGELAAGGNTPNDGILKEPKSTWKTCFALARSHCDNELLLRFSTLQVTRQGTSHRVSRHSHFDSNCSYMNLTDRSTRLLGPAFGLHAGDPRAAFIDSRLQLPNASARVMSGLGSPQ